MRSTGVIAHHTTDAASVRSGGLGAEKEPVWLAGDVQFIAYHTGFYQGVAFLGVDLQDPVHIPTDVCYDSVANDLSGDRRTARTSDEVRVATTSFVYQPHDVILVLGVSNAVRDLAVHARIRRVRYLMQTIS